MPSTMQSDLHPKPSSLLMFLTLQMCHRSKIIPEHLFSVTRQRTLFLNFYFQLLYFFLLSINTFSYNKIPSPQPHFKLHFDMEKVYRQIIHQQLLYHTKHIKWILQALWDKGGNTQEDHSVYKAKEVKWNSVLLVAIQIRTPLKMEGSSLSFFQNMLLFSTYVLFITE